MNSEEIKQSHSMREIVESYRIKVNRSGMCCCPFHKEKHPSMKVYKDSCYCFVCNKQWDIFSFIQDMDNIGFKDVFLSMGGTYQKLKKNASDVAKSRREIEHEAKKFERKQQDEIMMIVAGYLFLLEQRFKQVPDISEQDENWIQVEWVDAKIAYTILNDFFERYSTGKEMNSSSVFRAYQGFERKLNSFLRPDG